jgi:hypothetical protein
MKNYRAAYQYNCRKVSFFFDKYFCKVSFVSIFASANKGTTVQNNVSLLSSLNEKNKK